MAQAQLIDTLPQLLRLALAYAPASARSQLLTLLALDRRLGSIVRSSHEPMLAQLRLAWWREQVTVDQGGRPQGEPLLAALEHWRGPSAVLAGLADGWEGMTGNAPLAPSAFAGLADARAAGFAALAIPAEQAKALRMGRNWALFDIATHLSHPAERQSALALARAQDWRHEALPRALRPLAVLHGLAAKAISRDDPGQAMTPLAMLAAMRIGLFGR
jgi:15-cis-phytoene synthase